MHTSLSVTPPVDAASGTSPAGAGRMPLARVCIVAPALATPAWLEALRSALPATLTLASFGALANPAGGDVPSVAFAEGIATTNTLSDLVAAAAAAFPGAHLILLQANQALPDSALERLLRALEEPGVLAALPLDDRELSVLRTGENDPGVVDARRLDALCFAYSDRRLIDIGTVPALPGPVSAWHGGRLAAFGAARLRDADALAASGLRIVMLDHLYVADVADVAASPEADPRDPPPPSPLQPLRERIAIARRGESVPATPGLDARPVLLHVLHGWGGGAERWMRDLAGADRDAHHLVLIARGSFARRRHGEWLELYDATLAGPPLRRIALPVAIADTAPGDAGYRGVLAELLRDYCVDAIVVSSLIGHSLDVLRTRLPLFCIVHDHYPLWPVLHRDFGDPALAFDDAQRAADLAALRGDGEFGNASAPHWRTLRDATVAGLLDARATLIAPSRSALSNHLRLAPELRALAAHVIPHGVAALPATPLSAIERPRPSRLRLLLPGRIRRGKGAELLMSVLPRLLGVADIFLVGAGSDAHALFGTGGVHVILDYRRDDLPGLLARIRPDAALLLPTVAETFSYTLSEMRLLGVPVIATRRGALVERIEHGVDGLLVDANADAIAELVGMLAMDPAPLAAIRSFAGVQTTTAAMARAYSGIFALAPQPPVRYPLKDVDGALLEAAALVDSVDALRRQQSRDREQADALRRESDERGAWGHRLDRELGHARAALGRAHADLDDRTRWALALDAELADVKPRYEQMLGSDSWRLTAPPRAANARLRGLRAALAFRILHLRNVAGRVRGSLAQRGVGGTLARIASELGGRSPQRAPLAYPAPQDDSEPFGVPTSDAPRVSIVIPVFNKIAYTSACLRSLALHAASVPFEAIVVDDGSGDSTPQRLADIAGIRYLRNAENLGFVGSCNAGAAIARGECVLFLNNDTVVTAGWLEALVACLESAPDAGLVGARLVYPDGRLQEAGGIVFADGSGWNVGRFGDPADSRYGFRREVDYCSGAAILLRRALFEELGGFDERYAPAYYEDTDLAFAVRARGLKVWYEPASTVVHFEGITSGTDVTSGVKRYQVVNREKFLAKWQAVLPAQPAVGTPITIAATHRARKRVLIVDATTPTPDQDSGSLRMVNLMRVLADLGCQTSFLPDNRAWIEGYTPALQALGVEALYSPYAANPVTLFRERGREFDLIILSRHYVAASFVGLARLYAPQARLVFDTVDLHYLREQRAAELSGKAELVRHAAATRAQELKLIRECDVTLVVSPVEQELLSRDAPGARVDVLSNVHEVYGSARDFGARRDLVFIGGFQHPPNTDAVGWFVSEVFPLIRTHLPDVIFHVIGSKVPDAIRALADEQVRVHGYVEDITPYMDGCRLSVAPLRYGAGVKGKVNMAMSHGLPVVATTIAVEGMHVAFGDDVLVADDAAAFASAVLRLYRDEALWHRLSVNGVANVEQHFSFAAARTAALRLFD